MILKFIVACHVSTIPKSPPKIIREVLTFKEVSFFYAVYLIVYVNGGKVYLKIVCLNLPP